MTGSGLQKILQGVSGILAPPCSVILVSCCMNISRGVQHPFGQLRECAVAADKLDAAHRGRGLAAQLIGLIAGGHKRRTLRIFLLSVPPVVFATSQIRDYASELAVGSEPFLPELLIAGELLGLLRVRHGWAGALR